MILTSKEMTQAVREEADRIKLFGIKEILKVAINSPQEPKKEEVREAVPFNVLVLPKRVKQKQGYNRYKTKLNREMAEEIFYLATTTDLRHKYIAERIKLKYGVEIVPKTVSDIKLGKRWKKLNLVRRANNE